MIIAIIIAVVLAFLAFRFIAGMFKFGALAIIILVVVFLLMRHGGLG